MQIQFHKTFTKHFLKLDQNLQKKVTATIALFEQEPFHPKLNNHILHGELFPRRALSVTGNVRLIFLEYDQYALVIFTDVGTQLVTICKSPTIEGLAEYVTAEWAKNGIKAEISF